MSENYESLMNHQGWLHALDKRIEALEARVRELEEKERAQSREEHEQEMSLDRETDYRFDTGGF